MFGYVTVCEPELKMKDFRRYKAYYCGLCQTLKERYGSLGQLTLTYDMTFAIILLTSLYEKEVESESHRCKVHPVKKQNSIPTPRTPLSSLSSANLAQPETLFSFTTFTKPNHSTVWPTLGPKGTGQNKKSSSVSKNLTTLHPSPHAIYSLEEKTDLNHDCTAAKKPAPRGMLQKRRGHVTTGDLELKNGLRRPLRRSDFEKRPMK